MGEKCLIKSFESCYLKMVLTDPQKTTDMKDLEGICRGTIVDIDYIGASALSSFLECRNNNKGFQRFSDDRDPIAVNRAGKLQKKFLGDLYETDEERVLTSYDNWLLQVLICRFSF